MVLFALFIGAAAAHEFIGKTPKKRPHLSVRKSVGKFVRKNISQTTRWEPQHFRKSRRASRSETNDVVGIEALSLVGQAK